MAQGNNNKLVELTKSSLNFERLICPWTTMSNLRKILFIFGIVFQKYFNYFIQAFRGIFIRELWLGNDYFVCIPYDVIGEEY